MSDPRLLSVNVARMRLIVLSGETVKTGIYKAAAEEMKKKLTEAGATVEIK